jgi:hypothetical protein
MSNALEILAATRSIAQRLAESAEQYLGAMSAAGQQSDGGWEKLQQAAQLLNSLHNRK